MTISTQWCFILEQTLSFQSIYPLLPPPSVATSVTAFNKSSLQGKTHESVETDYNTKSLFLLGKLKTSC